MLHDGRPLVFVTVGTDHHPFDRLVAWVDEWMLEGGGASRARVFVQLGTARPPRHASWDRLVPRPEMKRLLETAAAVVCHGGPASITECRAAGTVPIVVPRNHRLGEHVDDHQVRFTERMSAAGKVHLAGSAEQLGQLLDLALITPEAFRLAPGADRISETVAEFERLVNQRLSEHRARPLRPAMPSGRRAR